MAGHRRAIERRGEDGRARPLVPVERASRLQASVRGRYAAAQDDCARLAAEVDGIRSVIRKFERAKVDVPPGFTDDAIEAVRVARVALTAALAQLRADR